MIEKYLADLEERIDPQAEEDLLAQWKAFTDGQMESGFFAPRRRHASPPSIPWPEVRVNQALEDMELMALQQFSLCSRALAEGWGLLMCVRANYGTGILPSVMGAPVSVMPDETNTLPSVRPLPGGREAVQRLLERGVPDLRAGYGGKVFAMGEYYLDLMKDYPKVSRFVHIYHPDLQGPMDVCELLWGSALFVELVDRPDLVKSVLALVTETYIRFMREWDRVVPPRDGYAVQWGLFHRGRIFLRDDSAMNLSPSMFEEFVEPYDQRLLDEFGGGGIHFCGRGDHYIGRVGRMRGVYAVNLSQPEYNDMEVIFSHTVDRGIKVLALRSDAVEEAVRRGRDLRGNVHRLGEGELV